MSKVSLELFFSTIQIRKIVLEILEMIHLDLVGFSFFAWFAAQNVPETRAKLGQETKNEGQDNEHPTL